jgi:hypothetical protein
VNAEEQGQVAVDALLLEDLRCANAFPRRGELDEHAIAPDARGLVLRRERARLRNARLGVEREARVDLGGDATRDDLEDLEAELDGEAIDRDGDRGLVVAAALLLRVDERVVDELFVIRHQRGGCDERRVRGRVPRLVLLHRVHVAGVSDNDGHGLQLLE